MHDPHSPSTPLTAEPNPLIPRARHSLLENPPMPRIPLPRLPWLALLLCAPLAVAQTAPLNDTGQTQCYDGSALVACTPANTGNAAPHPGQDGRYGRDRAALTKVGGGAAGFDFTALDASGNVTTTLGSHACVYDNVTGLLWSTEVLSMTWNAATVAHPSNGSGSYSRCGRTTGWRLPTRRELLSIVHNGAYNPAIDATYFPGSNIYFWTADTYAPSPASAWFVSFSSGYTYAGSKPSTNAVRLVRSGQ